ncbi:kinase-like protein [Rhizophagus irregularis]|uniref:Kinase-like protein n=1 Tax=Rhizophagus irregularis TaxID=588596 RepID=A0A2N0RK46_9GLOM|nr:kinase-like protein [Rhizophagus irregularis]
MSNIRYESVFDAVQKLNVIDFNNELNESDISSDMDKRFEFQKQMIYDDETLTEDEKSKAINMISNSHDYNKVMYQLGKKRFCEYCQNECFATQYCEYCIQNYLKEKFSDWTSGNNEIDDLIKVCQTVSLHPDMIIEWVPFNSLQNIEFLAQGGFSKVYTADWIDGDYFEWDSKSQQLKRYGTIEKVQVVLKNLGNLENANKSWFDEAKVHLVMSNKYTYLLRCLGLTQDPSNGDYMLIMRRFDTSLRKYLQSNHDQLKWKERIEIASSIITSLFHIHIEGLIHKDLHSGNILYKKFANNWVISDFGFCGPIDEPLGSVYGNLPYMAPESFTGKGYSLASDVYSIAMLMWEISSGLQPFANYENNFNLAVKIIKGMRPDIVSGTPLKYKELMEKCWDADPSKRPDISVVLLEMNEIEKCYHQNISLELFQSETNTSNLITSSETKKSEVYQFGNLSIEPKNATEEEQKVPQSESADFLQLYDDF